MSGDALMHDDPHALPALWRARADALDQYASTAAATTCRTLAEELELALRAEDNDTVTLAEAEKIGGFTADWLSRLIRQGKIENLGKRGAPRIRRSDIPYRPGHGHRRSDVLQLVSGDRTFVGVRADRDGRVDP